jgi:mannose-6-phosphate isomerase-like protein (cupin superfamily)
MYGGSTTSILLNIPGEAASVVTCLDGYKMAKQGRAGAALGVSAIGSFFAGTISIFGLSLLAPFIASLALKFGPAEYFSLVLLGLMMAVYLSEESNVKGLTMAALGLLLGTVGIDPVHAEGGLPARFFNPGDDSGPYPGKIPSTIIDLLWRRSLHIYREAHFGSFIVRGSVFSADPDLKKNLEPPSASSEQWNDPSPNFQRQIGRALSVEKESGWTMKKRRVSIEEGIKGELPGETGKFHIFSDGDIAGTKHFSLLINEMHAGINGLEHSHAVEHAWSILRGRGRMYRAGMMYEIRPGMAFFAPAEVPHKIEVDEQSIPRDFEISG